MASEETGMSSAAERAPPTLMEELTGFAVLAILIWPFIAIAVVGGFGFLVWMFQLIFGPPGPPG